MWGKLNPTVVILLKDSMNVLKFAVTVLHNSLIFSFKPQQCEKAIGLQGKDFLLQGE